MSITPLPAAPSRLDADFSTKADAFLGALPGFVTEVNQTAAILAAAEVGASKWISGTTYASGDLAWSPVNYRTYRRITAGGGVTDPSLDAVNWQQITPKLYAPDHYQWPTVANNSTDADHDIDFSVGSILSSDGVEVIALGSALTKQIDATWAQGNDAGGLFSGAVAADTTYHLFLIVSDSDGTVDAGFDTDLNCANIPAGYTRFRRVASLYTDGSANLVRFVQTGHRFELAAIQNDFNTGSPSTTGALVTMLAPTGLELLLKISVELINSSSTGVWLRSPAADNDAVTNANRLAFVSASGQSSNVVVDVQCNSAAQLRYRSDVGSVTTLRLRTLAWIDERIS